LNKQQEDEMKKVLVVQHVDGRVEYACPKCDTVMEWHEGGGNSFSRGEVEDNTYEVLICPNPDCAFRTENIPDLGCEAYTLDA